MDGRKMNVKSKKKYLQKKYRLPMYLHKKYWLSPHGYSPTKILNKKTRVAIEECESGKCAQFNSLE